MKRFLLLICTLFLFGWGMPLQAQSTDSIPDKEYRAALEELLEVAGTFKTVRAVFPQLMSAFHKAVPNVPLNVLDEITGRFQERYLEEYVDLLLPIYRKHLDIEDIKGFITFYGTPLGKKLLSVNTSMAVDAVNIGQEAGERIMKEILEELIHRGYEVKSL